MRFKLELLFTVCKICVGPPCLRGPQIETSLNNEVPKTVFGPKTEEVATLVKAGIGKEKLARQFDRQPVQNG